MLNTEVSSTNSSYELRVCSLGDVVPMQRHLWAGSGEPNPCLRKHEKNQLGYGMHWRVYGNQKVQRPSLRSCLRSRRMDSLVSLRQSLWWWPEKS